MMMNPTLDQERAQFLHDRVASGSDTEHVAAWKRPSGKILPVVDLEIDWVRFSTKNHRTKAEQLKAIKIAGQDDLFDGDPLGEVAQQEQFKILSAPLSFKELKDDIRSRGQQNSAIVTAEGVLINGNRRSAALRSLYIDEDVKFARYVKCVVLPADATYEELVDLETELQIARTFQEDYSWVNEAFLIEEIFERESRKWERVAERMHRKKGELRELYDKLQQLHQLVSLSDNHRMHADFIENESAFNELAIHIKNKSDDEAEAVRSVYFLGTIAGVNYRDLRHLRCPEAADLVAAGIEAEVSLKPVVEMIDAQAPAAKDDTDVLLEDLLGDEPFKAKRVSDFLSFFAQRDYDENIDLPSGETVKVADLASTLGSVITSVARDAKADREDDDAVEAPVSRLDRSLKIVIGAALDLPVARSFPGWDEKMFQDKVSELEAALQSLRVAV